MTAPDVAARVAAWLDRLEGLLRLPERRCDWCAAEPGQWCIRDCGNPERWCEPLHVAADAAERAPSDRAAALITESIVALPSLLALARGVAELAEKLEGESVSAMTRADVARKRDDRVLYTTNVRHARVAHQAASALCGLLADAAPDTEETA